ncbi:bifunctional phosphopantothenoylcysteine decarboxylase/phosphopantothenate--cysteine ligase CoaBC [Syntrophotalea acetylenica]|uniref:bifunctional phosphopantothenoylcysteine decarboxylase/phosphopantothenate--cysteine ligase CoaBC n=1 Tax=Syntrophotalea acetylenica TaxID=29542 RepID=UPI002A361994|nr:bifunctional phosphopantothenoylcysteine decarboxylase/phosphopantothenate--cysteine ligase CoaBC [Syntrophotalea acetylenica]MDY0261128.1 bifunctional phosphopantothenoylcysteine decarboxylase/phosphopantothenate--cysteine ligase CoaBC [Syntrophotalea acetylenica]
MMTGKQIVVGVTGGIAAYRAAELVRLYVKAGAQVHVIMTRAAAEFITPLTFQTLSGNPVHTDLFSLISEREIGHITLADRADVLVVAPATANLIGKVAAGLADDLLTTTIMATKAPVLFVPAMNSNMWENPVYQGNQARLRNLGYGFVDPVSGLLACGWQGQGKMAEPDVVWEETLRLLTPQDLASETILVTAGPTREELDPVRYLSNHSSGKMGYAIARAASRRGARVILVSGPTCLAPPAGIDVRRVSSALQMQQAVMECLPVVTVVIKAAAVADYRPEQRDKQKIKKGPADRMQLNLLKNPDILSELGRVKGDRLLIGFAAETENLEEHALRKLKNKNLDMILANDVSHPEAGFEVDTNLVRIFYRNGTAEQCPLMSKAELADVVLDRLLRLRYPSAAGNGAGQ